MNIRWSYCLEKSNDALETMMNPAIEPKESVKQAYLQNMIHLKDDQVPEACLQQFNHYKELLKKYAKSDDHSGLNFNGTQKTSLARITSAFVDFYQSFLRFYYTDEGYKA